MSFAVFHHSGLVLCVVGCLGLLDVPANGQQEDGTPRAPVPTEIVTAKKVFIANAGEDNYSIGPNVTFSGAADRLYNQFYAAMKEWGRYELVSTPANADLVFEIGLTLSDNGWNSMELGSLRLAVREPHTNVVLWAFFRRVPVAMRQHGRDKNLDRAIADVVDDMKELAARVGGTPTISRVPKSGS